MKKKLKKEHSLLRDAIRDLDSELKRLRANKNKLERQLENFSNKIGDTQAQEIKLRNQISKLMKRETRLEKQRTSYKDRITDFKKRMEKIKAIESDLKEV